jgi:hypothetical protein
VATATPERHPQVVAKLDVDAVYELFGCLSKSLRYGASLDLVDGLKLTYTKEDCLIKVSGFCTVSVLARLQSGSLAYQPACMLQTLGKSRNNWTIDPAGVPPADDALAARQRKKALNIKVKTSSQMNK